MEYTAFIEAVTPELARALTGINENNVTSYSLRADKKDITEIEAFAAGAPIRGIGFWDISTANCTKADRRTAETYLSKYGRQMHAMYGYHTA